MKTSVSSTPAHTKSDVESQHKSVLKRIRSSPDADGMTTLKNLSFANAGNDPANDEQIPINCGQTSRK